MSFDPFASDSENVIPASEYQEGEFMPGPLTGGDLERVRARVQAPAISLIVVGILNIFWALYMLANGILWTVAPDFVIKAEKQFSSQFQNQGATRDEQMMQGIIISYPTAVLAFLASVLPIVGGLRMLSLKSYPISVSGAISAMVPCVSCMACCGVGEVIGIWALVVLLNPDVKSAFQ